MGDSTTRNSRIFEREQSSMENNMDLFGPRLISTKLGTHGSKSGCIKGKTERSEKLCKRTTSGSIDCRDLDMVHTHSWM